MRDEERNREIRICCYMADNRIQINELLHRKIRTVNIHSGFAKRLPKIKDTPAEGRGTSNSGQTVFASIN